MEEQKPIDLRIAIMLIAYLLLIAAGAFIAIPIGPVPIVLKNMFVLILLCCWAGNMGFSSDYGLFTGRCHRFSSIFSLVEGFAHFSESYWWISGFLYPGGAVDWVSINIHRGKAEQQARKGRGERDCHGSRINCGVWSRCTRLKVVTGLDWGKAIAAACCRFLLVIC